MTPKQEAALRLALEALEGALSDDKPYIEKSKQAITAIKEALAQQDQGQSCYCPNCEALSKELAAIKEALASEASEQPAQQQEPVAWYDAEKDCAYTLADCEGRAQDDLEPLYLAPPSKPWGGLTEEEVDECYYWKGRQWTTDELVRHVEAKLREKNA